MFKLKINYFRNLISLFVLSNFVTKFLEANINGSRYNETKIEQHSIIFLHGIGEIAKPWNQVFSAFCLPNTKIIVPTAEKIPLTLYAGKYVRAWFDFKALNSVYKEDVEGIKRSVSLVHKLIDQEVNKGILSTNIIVGGFSQGGALALLAGLKYKKKLAAIITMSSWFPYYDQFLESSMTHNFNISILICHGFNDSIIVPINSLKIAKEIKNVTKNVLLKFYHNLSHTVSNQEIRDVYNFIKHKFFGPLYGNLF